MKTKLLDKDYLVEATTEVLNNLKNNDSTCLLLPTGTGKTKIAQAVIKELGGRVLYLAPNHYILAQSDKWFRKNHLSKNITLCTYPGMLVREKAGDFAWIKQFSLVILDEMHRLGAEEWGRAFNVLRAQMTKGTKILGLTATEWRYLEGRDMAKELFDSNIAYAMSLTEAWERKVFMAPNYYIASLDEEQNLTALEEKASKVEQTDEVKKIREEVKKMRRNIERTNGVVGILKTALSPDNNGEPIHRLVIFHERVEETNNLERLFQDYLQKAGFTNIRFYRANDAVNNPRNYKELSYEDRVSTSVIDEINEFNRTDDGFTGLKVLLSINMLNEGLHLENCFAEIMYRSTTSLNIFMQQVGRVMSTENTARKPIIIDLVRNIETSDYIKEISYSKTTKRNFEYTEDGRVIVDTNEGEDKYSLSIISRRAELTELMSRFTHAIDFNYKKLEEWRKLAELGDLSYIE